MCDEWRNDFSRFLADMGRAPPGHTLGRIDVNGNYEPNNCRWETALQQGRAKTNNVYVDLRGERVILKDYAAIMGVSYKALHRRYRMMGEPLEEAVRTLQRSAT